jgi:histidyl-tRNA synthetase
MKAAGRQQARWVLIRGESELSANTIQLRDMESGEQRELPLNDIMAAL